MDNRWANDDASDTDETVDLTERHSEEEDISSISKQLITPSKTDASNAPKEMGKSMHSQQSLEYSDNNQADEKVSVYVYVYMYVLTLSSLCRSKRKMIMLHPVKKKKKM